MPAYAYSSLFEHIGLAITAAACLGLVVLLVITKPDTVGILTIPMIGLAALLIHHCDEAWAISHANKINQLDEGDKS